MSLRAASPFTAGRDHLTETTGWVRPLGYVKVNGSEIYGVSIGTIHTGVHGYCSRQVIRWRLGQAYSAILRGHTARGSSLPPHVSRIDPREADPRTVVVEPDPVSLCQSRVRTTECLSQLGEGPCVTNLP